jgi:hypothetical protein
MKLIRPLLFACLIFGTLGQIGCASVAGSTPAQTTQPSSIQTTSLSPNAVTAGQAGFVLTVKGANFERSSVVLWNGAARATSFVSANELTAQIAAADIATPPTASVPNCQEELSVRPTRLQLLPAAARRLSTGRSLRVACPQGLRWTRVQELSRVRPPLQAISHSLPG